MAIKNFFKSMARGIIIVKTEHHLIVRRRCALQRHKGNKSANKYKSCEKELNKCEIAAVDGGGAYRRRNRSKELSRLRRRDQSFPDDRQSLFVGIRRIGNGLQAPITE
ncbi:unnamed protein product [Citrullus colocynthis]|uniref:Uncharacterized protein n=1 Tax=Citrullus colocynthis TaxID=252529 RepID=A0ABP0Y4K8_9ROSI